MTTNTIPFFPKSTLSSNELAVTYHVFTFVPETSQFGQDHTIQKVRLENGLLFIDDLHVVEPNFGLNSVSWNQQTQDHFTAGTLHFSPNMVECYGTIALGENDTNHLLHTVFLSAFAPSVYTTQITKERFPLGQDPAQIPAEQWGEGQALEVGYKYNPGDALPTVFATLNKVEISDHVALNIVGNDHLQIVLTMGNDAEVYCMFDSTLYLSGQITFSTFGESFVGQITSTCQDRSTDKAYYWKGTTGNQHPLLKHSTNKMLLTANHLVTDRSLSLAELISLVPDDKVLSASFDMLVENMKWAMGQSKQETEWLSTFFNQLPPVLTPERQNLIEKNIDWYQDKFSIGYLSYALNSLTGEGAPDVKLNAEQAAKLDDYMTKGLGQTNDYAAQMNGVYQQAYLLAKPRLQAYIQDKTVDWAQKLFDFVTRPEQINALINRVYVTLDMTSSNNFATMLQVLDPSAEKSRKYQEMVMSRVLLQASMKTAVLDEEVTLSWMPEALEYFVEKYGTPEGQLQATNAEEDDRRVVADGLREAAGALGGFAGLAKVFTKLLITAKGSTLIEQSESAAEAFAREYPKLTTASRGILMICMAGGLFNVIVSFVGWTDLTTTQKVRTITSCVSLLADAAGLTIDILKGRLPVQTWLKLNQFLAQQETLGEYAQIYTILIEHADDDWIEIGAVTTSKMFDEQVRAIQTQGTRWAKIYGVASKVVAVIGIAVSAVFTVLSTIDFVNDIKDGKPVSKTVLDGILMVSNFATTACLILNLAFSMTVFAFAASVFAIVGLIVGLISLFLPEPKEETPSDKFMKEQALPFVNQLPAANQLQMHALTATAPVRIRVVLN